MKSNPKIKLQLSTFLFLSIFIYACSPKLYMDETKRYQAGTLTDAQMDSLYTFLKQNERLTLKDTIIIKYDFNKDDCWKDLNYQNAEFLNNVRWAFQKNILEKAEARPKVAIYQYREDGKSFSPIKSKGLEIETDSGFLRKLLFKEVTSCGTSAIIIPNGKFLLVKSDPQFSALILNAKDIEKKLQENLIR
ncbi:hypothetical protein J7E50_24675 [Pedobacter sp. ISL-68]|uniref:hypothetical protein n=1 Tax=unclassified Pedobacter TaxID=2628915 RepID=UPI001BE79DEA|nr:MULTISPECIES: hypothetical protein [unclassified Pedobacter]MBT2564882.1 hypothetical protein [Pedobacter sp. ISL-64]MBT2593439.1 hypothetical protein [Pedobacter sp. ISL-68]